MSRSSRYGWVHKTCTTRPARFRPLVELLETRVLLASDFGDAPLPYKMLLAESGAEHVAIGHTLGAS